MEEASIIKATEVQPFTNAHMHIQIHGKITHTHAHICVYTDTCLNMHASVTKALDFAEGPTQDSTVYSWLNAFISLSSAPPSMHALTVGHHVGLLLNSALLMNKAAGSV